MFTRSTIRWAAGAGHAFMDIAIGSQPPHRVTFELFTKKCPIASENFLKLCTGENVLPQVSSIDGIGEPSFRDQFLPQLTYRNTTVHRVCKGYLVQGGDIVSGQGTGQLSIYGEFFDAPEEVKASKFDRMGLLGTAVSAPHLNGSQFFILTADKAPHLNGTCICFGRVVDGWAVVKAIEAIPLTAAGEPTERVVVVECGKL
ncbi:Peptidyl-prolyl cis-trans isomerase / CYP10 / cyclophilin 10 / mitoribosomal protein mL92 [Leishmania donovani]|nr:cyclophilin_10_-_putative [Leishmania infantum]CAJ1993698.1 Peptidyl-prolyl cis-trans isomerase / CYP10 / cyclophilin 10 / mitoribosomal protein mL92 [Leishmania donovani]SUZ46704.1 cyclophilin_10_-_putative [Leishmania infantum]VDZ49519.1 cyclophilin_10_putative/GeneDB:LmjF.36.3130 [Leishmania donovani]